jgi:23S rRNA (guanine745-N1)-methyltransferase
LMQSLSQREAFACETDFVISLFRRKDEVDA